MQFPEIPLKSLEAARIAALLGDSFSLPVLFSAGVNPEDMDPLFDKHILEPEDATHAAFSDFALQEELLNNQPWSFRRTWSLKLAECLENQKGDSKIVGELFLSAQAFERARPYLIRAAEQACRSNEYREALSLLRQVFEVWNPVQEPENRPGLLREMARCAANTGDHETVGIAWEELLENASASRDLAGQLEAHQQLAHLATEQGNRTMVRLHLKAAADLSSGLNDPDVEAHHWFHYAGLLMGNVRLKDANAALEKAYQVALHGKDVAQRIEIMATRALGQAMIGNSEQAFSWIEEALNCALEQELPEQVTYAYRRMANVHEYSGHFQAYLDFELKALDRCRANKGESLEQACLSCLSYAFFRCGQWKRTQEMLHSVLEELEIEGELKMVALVARAAIAAFRGERRLAESTARDCVSLIGQFGGTYMQFHLFWALGTMAYLDKNWKRAEEEFGGLIDLWRDTEDRHDSVPGLLNAAAFFAERNQLQRLAECIDILNTIYSESNNTENKSARLAALAEDAWARGKAGDAIEFAETALAGYDELKMPIEIAFISRRVGLMFASKSDVVSAEKAWSRSEIICRELGMRPLLDTIRADRNNWVTKETAPQQAVGLTKRQKEVLALMADGLTNKEVAARLKLSPRTVEMHVGSVLERLNCRARTEAIKKAVKLGLV